MFRDQLDERASESGDVGIVQKLMQVLAGRAVRDEGDDRDDDIEELDPVRPDGFGAGGVAALLSGVLPDPLTVPVRCLPDGRPDREAR